MDKEELLRIRDAMVTRGPDSAGIWVSDDHSVGLAHRRLSIIDLTDSASQPMATEDGRLHIVFNGEIYNYRTLRTELKKKGYRFVTNSDTEVLLHLYSDRGDAMVESLRGMYAFAIWDGHKNALLLARDPLGIKPLYIANDGSSFRFASQVKALLQSKRVVSEPEAAGHAGFFLWGSVPEPYTLYKGIRALPAGTTLWVDSTGARGPRSFFRVADVIREAEQQPAKLDINEQKERIRTLLLDSVQHHMVADVQVGVFLSSGLDSATLTALASEVSSRTLSTVTLGFNEYRGSPSDEVPLAELTAGHYATSHVSHWVRREDFTAERERLLAAMDQPSIDGVNTYFVSKAAAESGLKVAISGLGGDELFGGYPSFRDVPRLARWFAPFRAVSILGRGFRLVAAPLLKHLTSPKYAGLLEYGGTFGGAYLLRRGFFMPWELPEILGPEMAHNGWKELQTLACLEHSISGIRSARLKVSALEMTWYMRNQLLRDADWAGMAHSLEIRVPLVDAELLRSIAPLLAHPTPPTKRMMAQTPQRALPPQIVNRRKTGFSVPVREWLTQNTINRATDRGLRGWARQVLPT